MLRSLQKKPLHTRMHVAFMVAFIVAMVVTAFWVATLPTKFAEIREANEQIASKQNSLRDAEHARDTQEAAALIGSFVASSTEAYRDLGSQLQGISGAPGTGGEDVTQTPSEGTTAESASSTIIIREIN